MTLEEFSNEFDVLLNSYSTIKPFGYGQVSLELDEYEKSVFLTKAQESIIINLYNGKNYLGDTFEGTEEIRRYLDNLIKTYHIKPNDSSIDNIDKNAVIVNLPSDVWFSIYESVDLKDDKLKCKEAKNVAVLPITHDEYHRIKNNPFRGNNYRRVLRINKADDIIELISKYSIDKYYVRYLTKPSPIILCDLPDGLSIDNINNKTECKLTSAIHRNILDKAVQLAVTSRASKAESK